MPARASYDPLTRFDRLQIAHSRCMECWKLVQGGVGPMLLSPTTPNGLKQDLRDSLGVLKARIEILATAYVALDTIRMKAALREVILEFGTIKGLIEKGGGKYPLDEINAVLKRKV